MASNSTGTPPLGPPLGADVPRPRRLPPLSHSVPAHRRTFVHAGPRRAFRLPTKYDDSFPVASDGCYASSNEVTMTELEEFKASQTAAQGGELVQSDMPCEGTAAPSTLPRLDDAHGATPPCTERQMLMPQPPNTPPHVDIPRRKFRSKERMQMQCLAGGLPLKEMIQIMHKQLSDSDASGGVDWSKTQGDSGPHSQL